MKKIILLFISWLYISTANAMETTAQPTLTDIPQELQAIIISIASEKDNLLNAFAEFKKQAAINKQFRNIVNNPHYIKEFIKIYISKHGIEKIKTDIPSWFERAKANKLPTDILKTLVEALIDLDKPEITYVILDNAIDFNQTNNLIEIFKNNQNKISVLSKQDQIKLINTAIGHGNLDMVKFLINAGVNINVKESTPLIAALVYGKIDIAEFLINNKNTDVTIVNNVGVTPLKIAEARVKNTTGDKKEQLQKIVNLIKEKSSKK